VGLASGAAVCAAEALREVAVRRGSREQEARLRSARPEESEIAAALALNLIIGPRS
jgi:hypothetical protein